ncbi:MAG TPA: NAD(P)/FAD-dependent oxidoreductase [Dehalococcoidia bacterium]|nr:NAD(P)/FAD-dependent oxidoreductase [Dehalococcoidia bacterium]
MDQFEVAVLGGGGAGENIARPLAAAGKRVALIEEARIGGACPFVACVPSKVMLRSAEVRLLLRRAPELGATAGAVDPGSGRAAYAAAVRRRERIVPRGDVDGERMLAEAGVDLFRGRGRVVRPGVLAVDQREIGWHDLVIATGSAAAMPPIDGLDRVPCWTSDEALTSEALPASLAVLGGGPVGCELAQVFAAFGCAVTIIEAAARLLPSEEPAVGDLLAKALAGDGVRLRLGVEARTAEPTPNGARLWLANGEAIEVERVLVATGRTPRVAGIGLEALGIEPGKSGIAIDARCRVEAQEHVWAAGDVAGVDPYTHTAEYQARIVVANLSGNGELADYRAIPRMVYTSPPVAAVGLTRERAEAEGRNVLAAAADLADTPRAEAASTELGRLELIADAERGVLIGAAAIGDQSDSWLGEALLAIRAELPIDTVAKVVHAFPTYNQIYDQALAGLLRQRDRSPDGGSSSRR